MKKTKILHLLNTTIFSGAENVVCQIINMFNNDIQYQMAYCSINGPINETLKEKGIDFYPIKKLSVKEVKWVIEDYRPDIIHAHDIRASVIAALCCKKCKLICTIHGNDLCMRRISKKSLSTLIFLRKADHIFWVSKSSFDDFILKSIAYKKSSILYNVVDRSGIINKVQADENKYDFDVVYLGRLTLPKNPHKLIDVLKIVVSQRSETKIAIIGTGDYEEEIRRRIERDNLNKNIFMLGFLNNPLKILADSKIMIMTSTWEGTPMVVLEALALGIPVVSTPTDGIRDFIQNDKNGYLSQSNDQLAKKVLEYISCEDKYNDLSVCALKTFEEKNNILMYKTEIEKHYNMSSPTNGQIPPKIVRETLI